MYVCVCVCVRVHVYSEVNWSQAFSVALFKNST